MNKKILGLGLSLTALTLPIVASAQQTLQGMVTTFAGALGGVGAGLAIIGFTVAGIMYIASTANPSMMSTAKQALVAAVIGIVILSLAKVAQGFVRGMFGV